MDETTVTGVIGASSFVGARVCSLLFEQGCNVLRFSRKKEKGFSDLRDLKKERGRVVENWVYVAPIWTLKEYYTILENCGCNRLVVLSSTSRFSKVTSHNPKEQKIAQDLIDGEEQAIKWAQALKIQLVILQPTMIYGYGRDENISNIIVFIEKFGFFPILGQGKGLRQPIHVDDVAAACVALLAKELPGQRQYIIAGKEVVSYREMVARIFQALNKRERIVRCPMWLFTSAVRFLKCVPKYKNVTLDMVTRMNVDLTFSYEHAQKDWGFAPAGFLEVDDGYLTAEKRI